MDFKPDVPAPRPSMPEAEAPEGEKEPGVPRPRFKRKLDKLIVRLARDGFNDESIAADEEVQKLRPGVTARQIAKRRTRLGWHRKQPPAGHPRIPTRRIVGVGIDRVREHESRPPAQREAKHLAPFISNLPLPGRTSEDVDKSPASCEVILRFTNGREIRMPMTERQAEALALRMVKGDL